MPSSTSHVKPALLSNLVVTMMPGEGPQDLRRFAVFDQVVVDVGGVRQRYGNVLPRPKPRLGNFPEGRWAAQRFRFRLTFGSIANAFCVNANIARELQRHDAREL